jgi:tripartite-type tricarboxylate transporter receptor subunit TctC
LHQALSILVCVCAGFAVDCAAQFPARAIRIIVPVPPGASLDTLARTVGARLSARIGQTVLIEHQPGGAGNIAYGNVAKAAPDGYTLLLGWDGLQINTGLYKNLPYQLSSFAPITMAITAPQILVVNNSLPARNLGDYIALAKRQRGRMTAGSPGSGSPGHLAAALFMTLTGTELIHVPYKGGAPAAIDVIARARLFIGGAWEPYADLPIHGKGKARAIDAVGGGAPGTIRCSDVFLGQLHGLRPRFVRGEGLGGAPGLIADPGLFGRVVGTVDG